MELRRSTSFGLRGHGCSPGISVVAIVTALHVSCRRPHRPRAVPSDGAERCIQRQRRLATTTARRFSWGRNSAATANEELEGLRYRTASVCAVEMAL